nr:auxin-responsive protein SAUR68-like [Ipomoea batatas]
MDGGFGLDFGSRRVLQVATEIKRRFVASPESELRRALCHGAPPRSSSSCPKDGRNLLPSEERARISFPSLNAVLLLQLTKVVLLSTQLIRSVFMDYIISLLSRGLSQELENALLVSVTSHKGGEIRNF